MKFLRIRINRKWFFRGIIASLIVAVVVIGALLNPQLIKKLPDRFSTVFFSEAEPWVLEVATVYSECGHEEIVQTQFDSEQKLRESLLENSEIILQGAPEDFLIRGKQNSAGFCLDCQDKRFIGISNQKIAVFRGTPAKPGQVVEETELAVELLPQAEQEDLQRGIVFKTEEEKLEFLEGLNGFINN